MSRSRLRRTAFALGLAALFAGAARAGTALPPEVARALARERIPAEAMTVVVQEAGGTATRLSIDARRPVNPASVFKLLTTYAALDELGPAFTWMTPVWLAGPIRNGVLEGNIHLQGRGDPKLTRCSASARWASRRSAATS
jgi:D-alanyl-D-alanine carboxypeptidase/D-alanyl-D-alanine-endopeptidase (penicillin-binding protein 4)